MPLGIYLSKRCYVCDRDRNSTVAIMLRFLSQNAMWTGYQQFVGNLRNTGLLVPWSYSTCSSGMLEVHSQ
ncbi:MAG: hypothetical protein O8C59_04385, partial [Candidatus Methanoperedens sp.]|nr:hypothetical protein [Candidatus Methanoperedens sp.]